MRTLFFFLLILELLLYLAHNQLVLIGRQMYRKVTFSSALLYTISTVRRLINLLIVLFCTDLTRPSELGKLFYIYFCSLDL